MVTICPQKLINKLIYHVFPNTLQTFIYENLECMFDKMRKVKKVKKVCSFAHVFSNTADRYFDMYYNYSCLRKN